MPISRDEFERGEADPGAYILNLLRNNADTAFTLDELLQAASVEGHSFSSEQILEALERLIERGGVQSKMLKGVVYYIYHRAPMGFRPG